MSDNRKTLILEALRAFVAQRPGFDTGNYDRAGYRADSRKVTQQRHDFDRLVRSVETLDEITADDLIAAFPRAFSGRLTLMVRTMRGTDIVPRYELDYCTGQYWCTEYRAAACAVLASALWACQRNSLPEPTKHAMGDPNVSGCPIRIEERYDGKSAGEWLRRSFRHWYGRGIQSRWFS